MPGDLSTAAFFLAVLGTASAEGLTVRDAAELRVKETHRIAMAGAVAARAADGESTVAAAEAAAVSYPDFFRDLARLRYF